MRLYIVRHGETKWNRERRLQGSTDVELNDKGIALAKSTGKALAEVPFRRAFSSPLRTADAAYSGRAAEGDFLRKLGGALHRSRPQGASRQL